MHPDIIIVPFLPFSLDYFYHGLKVNTFLVDLRKIKHS